MTPEQTARQVAAVEAALRVFHPAGACVEMRALNVQGRRAVCETFADPRALARRAAELDALGASGIYFTLNPLRPDLLGSKASCRKADVIQRHWLPLDVDPYRPRDCSSSEPEMRAAWAVLSRCRGLLDAAGLSGAVVGCSGNGWHLCYPILLPNSDEAQALVKAVLKALHAKCGDKLTAEEVEQLKTNVPLAAPKAKVEEDVHDAPRIWKLYGTRARKGQPAEDRPHRWARLIEGEPWDRARAEANAKLLRQLPSSWKAAEDLRRGRPQTDANTYAAAALRAELEAVAASVPGARNNQLNVSAFNLGTLCGSGALCRPEIEAALLSVAEGAGLAGREARATIKSGLDAGSAQPRVLASLNGHANGKGKSKPPEPPRPDADSSDDPLDADATAADLIAANVTIGWAWPKWLPQGVLSVLASEPGIGKTRFCADLARRVYHGLPWPDGSAPTFPHASKTLWIPADNQHAELGSLPQEFCFPPESLYLNASRRNPFGGTMLDDEEDLREFERRIARVKPAIIFVDTSLNATDRSSHKPEDAKAFFVPLQQIAARQGCVMLCVTHLNAAGKPLGRRIAGQARMVMQLEKPDESQENRRKLYVVKSNSLYPAPLGVTMGMAGNEYDLNPPQAPGGEPGRGAPDPKAAEAREWLREFLAAKPRRVGETRTAAELEGIAAGSLYRARDVIGVVEYTDGGKKWWRLPPDLDASTPFDDAIQFASVHAVDGVAAQPIITVAGDDSTHVEANRDD